jgi:hypothetical protein
MSRILVIVTLACALFSGACYAPAFYADIQGNNYAQPGALTTSGGKILTGTACWTSYVGIVALGDASVAMALKNAGVDPTKPIKNMIVDHKVFAIGPFYTEYCTVVTVTAEGGGGGGGGSAAAAAPSDASASAGEGKKEGGEDDSFDWKSD